MLNVVDQVQNSFFQEDFISTKQITLPEVELLLARAKHFKQIKQSNCLQHKIIATCFFEPSTRTRLSFEAATIRLGGKNIGFIGTESISVQKGESLTDTMKMMGSYADLIVLRHAQEGAARLASEVVNVPVINAGDGINQHPTQAILDLFTMQECQKQLHGLSIALVGDLKHGRTVHSLLNVCALYDMRIYLVSPEMLLLPDALCDQLKQRGLRFSFHQDIEEVLPKVDVLYMTRIQKERFAKESHLIRTAPYQLTLDMLRLAKPNLKIFHPLPRVDELPRDIDNTPFAYYFQQAANGVPVRQALLSLILNEHIA